MINQFFLWGFTVDAKPVKISRTLLIVSAYFVLETMTMSTFSLAAKIRSCLSLWVIVGRCRGISDKFTRTLLPILPAFSTIHRTMLVAGKIVDLRFSG